MRRVIQLKTPWDVKRDLQLEQIKRVNAHTLNNTPSYLNEVGLILLSAFYILSANNTNFCLFKLNICQNYCFFHYFLLLQFQEEERIFMSLLESKSMVKKAAEKEDSPILNMLNEMEGRKIENIVWKMRRKSTPSESDLKRKYQPREIRADLHNINEGLQENRGQHRPGDPQLPLL